MRPTKLSKVTRTAKSQQDRFTECYLKLARLAHAMADPDATHQRTAALRDALEYVVHHCAFCGKPASEEALGHGVVRTFVCEECYIAPIRVGAAQRTLNDPAVTALARRAHFHAQQRVPGFTLALKRRPKLRVAS